MNFLPLYNAPLFDFDAPPSSQMWTHPRVSFISLQRDYKVLIPLANLHREQGLVFQSISKLCKMLVYIVIQFCKQCILLCISWENPNVHYHRIAHTSDIGAYSMPHMRTSILNHIPSLNYLICALTVCTVVTVHSIKYRKYALNWNTLVQVHTCIPYLLHMIV